MEDIQKIINRKAEIKANDDMNELLVKCLDAVCGTRTGIAVNINVGGDFIKANSSDIFRALFCAIEVTIETLKGR